MMKKELEEYKEEYKVRLVGLGVKSFARFFDLTLAETEQMLINPNAVVWDMIAEMEKSLEGYEDFMVKARRVAEKKEVLTRLDFLDL